MAIKLRKTIRYNSNTTPNGIVYVGNGSSNVYALNATTGIKIWSYTTGGDISLFLAIANGMVYVWSTDNLSALNARTGAMLWSF